MRQMHRDGQTDRQTDGQIHRGTEGRTHRQRMRDEETTKQTETQCGPQGFQSIQHWRSQTCNSRNSNNDKVAFVL